MPITRGFTGRADRRQARTTRADRLPPGQFDTGDDWPTLTAEATPAVDRDSWSLRVDGLVAEPASWTWSELRALPGSAYSGDIHCVTTWSKFDMTFTGVSVDSLLAAAPPLPQAGFVMAHSTSGYTTNIPLDDLTGGKAWVVWEADGKPLTTEHGGPLRLLVPHLYFWKSAKWVSRLEVMETDRPGFWEQAGYHDRGDPWLEQRYQGDA